MLPHKSGVYGGVRYTCFRDGSERFPPSLAVFDGQRHSMMAHTWLSIVYSMLDPNQISLFLYMI